MPEREPKQVSELHIARTRDGKMTHLSYTPRDEKERALVESLPGARPQGQGKEIRFNVDRFNVDALRRLLNGTLSLPDDVQEWYDKTVATQRTFVRLTQEKDITLPLEVATKLRDYQRIGAYALAEREKFILADKQGLGKTLEALVADHLVSAKRVLIVTLSGAKWQWQREIKQWFGEDATVVDGSQKQRKALLESSTKYLIIHYDILRAALVVPANKKTGAPVKPAQYPELVRHPGDVIIFDEAQKLQNPDSRQSQAAFAVARRTPHVFLLTGTPIWSMLDSLWGLLHVIDPAIFSSRWAYIDRYCIVAETLYGKKVTGTNMERLPELQERLSYYILQRTKEQVAKELPPKIFTTIPYHLSERQWHEYILLKDTLSIEYQKGTRYFGNAPAALTAMRRLCNNPHDLGLNYNSPKDDALLDKVENVLENEAKVAILCWHKDYARHIADLMDGKGVSYTLATGDTLAQKRVEAVEVFKKDNTRVLIGTIAAIGTALNIPEVSTAIFAELDWTPAMNEQATDRFHRLTSQRTVNIYYLIAENTIEEHILQVTQKKGYLADQALAIQEVVEQILARSSQKA